MRLKATPLACAFGWAPSSLGTPTFLAAASLAEAVDDDFSSSLLLEIRLVDVTQTDETDMPIVGRTPIPERALRVDWCPTGGPCGIIAVACVNGAVYVYDAKVIMMNYQKNPTHDTDVPLLCTIAEHVGAVRGCQFNPSQPNFLAIGADDCEWDVWTLEDPRDPKRVPVMSNGAHTAPIVHLQWHPKYPHIIATASANGIVNVWNLKLQTLAVSLNVSKGGKSGVSANAITWHPVVPTQIAVALDEKDPAIQIWDLKKSIVPLSEMRGHEGAITGLAWNPEDASMIASCGADGSTIWWNPVTGERSGTLQKGSGYLIDVRWSAVLPAVLATSSFEPLLCVATAEDAAAAAPAGAALPKGLIRPCGASVSLGGLVAALVPGSRATIGLTRVTAKELTSPMTSEVISMQTALKNLPSGSPERVEWLKVQNYHLFAALAACKDDRVPILAHLNEESAPPHEDGEDPFETIQASQKSVEDVSAAHIAAGRIREAVEVCLNDGRFDDAFAIAYLQGGKLLERVHREYTHHAMGSKGKRHVRYAAAVASGDIDSLTAGDDVLWREALSVIISFVGDGFSAACDKLGASLKALGNREGAITCFVCSGNVDAVMELWREDNVPVKKMMREALLLEEVTGRRVTSSFFSECLYEYGMRLVGDGLITEAMPILQRSTAAGNRDAAVMVDRLKFGIPNAQTVFPFSMMLLPDSPSPACVAFLSAKQNQNQNQNQEHMNSQHQRNPHMPTPHHHHHHNAPPLPQTQQQQPPPGHGAATVSQPMHHPNSSHSSMRQGTYIPSAPSPQFTTPGEFGNGIQTVPAVKPQQQQHQNAGRGGAMPPPPPQRIYADPGRISQPSPVASRGPSMPAMQPPLGPPPQPGVVQQSVSPHAGNHAAPPPPPPPPHPGAAAFPTQHSSNLNTAPPMPPPPQQHLQPQAAPGNPVMDTTLKHESQGNSLRSTFEMGNISSRAPLLPPQGSFPPKTSMAQPNAVAPPPSNYLTPPSDQGSYPPASYGGSTPASRIPYSTPSVSGSAIDDGGLSSFNIASLSPGHQALAQKLCADIKQMSNMQRRSAVSKAALEMFKMLQQGMLSAEVVGLLSNYVNAVGTPSAKNVWRQLSNMHFDVIQPFMNLKFL